MDHHQIRTQEYGGLHGFFNIGHAFETLFGIYAGKRDKIRCVQGKLDVVFLGRLSDLQERFRPRRQAVPGLVFISAKTHGADIGRGLQGGFMSGVVKTPAVSSRTEKGFFSFHIYSFVSGLPVRISGIWGCFL